MVRTVICQPCASNAASLHCGLIACDCLCGVTHGKREAAMQGGFRFKQGQPSLILPFTFGSQLFAFSGLVMGLGWITVYAGLLALVD